MLELAGRLGANERPTNETLSEYFCKGLRRNLRTAVASNDIAAGVGGFNDFVTAARRAEKRLGTSKSSKKKKSSRQDSDSETDAESDTDSDTDSDSDGESSDSDMDSDSDDSESEDRRKKKKKKSKKDKKKQKDKDKQDRKRKGKGKEVTPELNKQVAATLRSMGITAPQQKEKPFCQICQKTGHTDNYCWYNPTNRANPGPSIPRGNAPATNLIAPDRNREGGGPARRFQQRNSWGPPPPQGACNMNNVPCTYCGELNHRQGPNCPLWCKHRNERGIPIVRFNENQRQTGPPVNQQNRPAQANVVIVEEQEALPTVTDQIQNDKDLRVLHVECDCLECQKEDNILEEPAAVLAVTRSGKQNQKDQKIKEGMFKDPTVWEDQRKVRMGFLKEIQKQQSQEKPEQITEAVFVPVSGNVGDLQQKQRKSVETKGSLLLTKTMISLDQILSLVPEFKKQILFNLAQDDGVIIQSAVCNVEPEDVDYKVPRIKVLYEQEEITGTLVDGGSGVNILPEFVYKKMQLSDLEAAPFQLKMADQRRIQPLGILRNQKITISSLSFFVNFVVIKMNEGDSPYPLLLGRPWLKTARVKQDWGAELITIRQGKKKVKIQMVPTEVLPRNARALYAQGINMVEELADDEEDEFLKVNSSVIPVFEINVANIVEQYKSKRKQNTTAEQQDQQNTSAEQEQEEQLKTEEEEKFHIQQIIKAEQSFEEHLSKLSRVKEDDLQELNLGSEGEPQTVKISVHVEGQFKQELIDLLQEFKDIFAWKYTDMKGVDPQFCMHKINLKKDAVPVVSQRYRMNPNYAKAVKEELDKLLKVGFIYPLKQVTWLSPIVIVPKKNGKLRICVDYRKLNAATETDPFPLPFQDTLLDAVAGHQMYSFLDGFSGYNQILMAPEDRDKTAFVTEWGVFASNVMTFGLKNAPPTFQKWVQEVFAPFLTTFMRVFLDDFSVFGNKSEHLGHLRLCFERCRLSRLSLNPAKCAFAVEGEYYWDTLSQRRVCR